MWVNSFGGKVEEICNKFVNRLFGGLVGLLSVVINTTINI